MRRFLLTLLIPLSLCVPVSSQSAAQGGSLSASEVFRKVKPTIALILGSTEATVVQGSGFIVGKNRVATNHHVISGVSQAIVKFSDGGIGRVEFVVSDDESLDLAILSVNTGARPAIVLGDELALREGDSVFALGAPRGLELSFTNGIISSFRRDGAQFLIQTTAPIAPGSSGGPLVDSKGRAVGVTTFQLKDSAGIYFSVAISELKRLLKTALSTPMTVGETSTSRVQPVANRARNEILAGNYDSARQTIGVLEQTGSSGEVEAKSLSQLIQIMQARSDHSIPPRIMQVANQYPHSGPIRANYAFALIQSGEFRKGLGAAKLAERLESTEWTESVLALASYLLGDWPTAKEAANRARQYDSDDHIALEVETGVLCAETPGSPDWIAKARRLRELAPLSSWALILDAYELQGQSQANDRAIVDKLQQATNTPGPINDYAYSYLAGFYQSRENSVASARDLIRKGLSAMPESPRLLSTMVTISLKSGDVSEAATNLALLDDIAPESDWASESGCMYYYVAGRPSMSLPLCRTVSKKHQDSAQAHANYGWAALDSNDLETANAEFTDSVRLIQSSSANTQIDVSWGLILVAYYRNNRPFAKSLFDSLKASDPTATTISGLRGRHLLYSASTLSRIAQVREDLDK